MLKYTILLQFQEEKHIKKERCYCQRQLCHEWFIPTRIGQKTCLFDLAERNLLNLYPMITHYEVINKKSGQILPVDVTTGEASGQGEFITLTWKLEDGTPIVFNNPYGLGQLHNDEWAIREINTKSQADGSGIINDLGIPTE